MDEQWKIAMTSRSEAHHRTGGMAVNKKEGWLGLVVGGSVIGAIAASSCCILPLVLFALGAGGAWVGNLTALAPYQPVFIILTLALLAYGFWMVHRRAACVGNTCARSRSDRFLKIGLWSATLCVAAALAFPFLAAALLGS
jgi:mercuric ion transport protein